MLLQDTLRTARRAAGLSQEALAERVGVSRQAVTKWESGAATPEVRHLAALSQALGVPVQSLLAALEGMEETAAAAKLPTTPEEAGASLAQRNLPGTGAAPAPAMGSATPDWRLRLRMLGLSVVIWAVFWLWLRMADTPDIAKHSAVGFLFGNDFRSYLPGWLTQSSVLFFGGVLFWGVVFSLLPAFLGRWRAAFVMQASAMAATPLGQWLGDFPPGAPYGNGHYGWAIWLGLYAVGAVMGFWLERLCRKPAADRRTFWRRILFWAVIWLAVSITVILFVRTCMMVPVG